MLQLRKLVVYLFYNKRQTKNKIMKNLENALQALKHIIEDERTVNAITRNPYDGFQIELEFKNGYGCSLVNHSFSYGTELAVLNNGSLCYSTHITDDVLGYLTEKQAIENIEKIMSLKEIED